MKIRKSEGLNNFSVMEILIGRGKGPLAIKREGGYRLHEREGKGNNNMYKDVLTQILINDNLNEAYKQVMRNKGAAGVDGMNINKLGGHLARNKEEIIRQIQQRKYQPQPVLRVEIPKPDGGVRLLGIPTVTDRVIQQTISQVLTPIFDSQFSDNSYGFRPKRYAEMAIVKALE